MFYKIKKNYFIFLICSHFNLKKALNDNKTRCHLMKNNFNWPQKWQLWPSKSPKWQHNEVPQNYKLTHFYLKKAPNDDKTRCHLMKNNFNWPQKMDLDICFASNIIHKECMHIYNWLKYGLWPRILFTKGVRWSQNTIILWNNLCK